MKSDAFLEKIAKGNVFTFPAGQEKPVQITANSYGYIEFSKPLDKVVKVVDAKKPTEPHEPKPLSGWKRFINAITFGAGYKKDVAEYKAKTEQYERDKKEYPDKWAEYERQVSAQTFTQLGLGRIKNEREPDDMKAELADEGRKEQALFDAAMDKNYVSKLDAQIATMTNFYKPSPVQDSEITGNTSGKAYTQEQFDKLKPIDISRIKIGGKQLTDDQFASLAMCAALLPDISGPVRAPEYGEGHPFTNEELVMVNNTFFTCDLGMEVKENESVKYRPRENAGAYFGPVIQQGRSYAKMALDEFMDGKPERLAKLIAYGAKFQMENTVHPTFDMTANLMNDVVIGRLGDLATKDTNLFLALQKEGVSSKMLLGMQGTKDIAKIYRENERAKTLLQLDSNKKFVEGLSNQERTDCIKARLDYEAANESIRQHRENREKDPKYEKAYKQAEEAFYAAQVKPAIKEGETEQQYAEQIAYLGRQALIARGKMDLVMNKGFGMPDVYMAAGSLNGVRKLSQALAPDQDKLMNLKGQELEDALNSPTLMSATKSNKEPVKTTPTVQKEVQKTADMGLQAG